MIGIGGFLGMLLSLSTADRELIGPFSKLDRLRLWLRPKYLSISMAFPLGSSDPPWCHSVHRHAVRFARLAKVAHQAGTR